MKLAVVGSRTFNDYELMKRELNKLSFTSMVSGGAVGADSYAERYAKEFGIPIEIIRPDWKKYGRSAGMVRNKLIVDNADLLISFWDGKSKGTKHSIDYATARGKEVEVIRDETTIIF